MGAVVSSPRRLPDRRSPSLNEGPGCPGGRHSGRAGASDRDRPHRSGPEVLRMSGGEIDIIAAIQSAGAAIAPLHRPIRPPRGSDWLAVHDEPGQTFLEYLASDPVLPTRSRT